MFVPLSKWRREHGVSRTTAWRLVKEGVLQTTTLGRRVFVTGTRTGSLPEPDLRGRRFGVVEVVGDSGQRTHVGTILWTVRCACGRTFTASRAVLETRAVHCGCGARPSRERPAPPASLDVAEAARAQNGRCAVTGWPLPARPALVRDATGAVLAVHPRVRRAMLGVTLTEFKELCAAVCAHNSLHKAESCESVHKTPTPCEQNGELSGAKTLAACIAVSPKSHGFRGISPK